jgi:hypothetical protein
LAEAGQACMAVNLKVHTTSCNALSGCKLIAES